VVELQPGDHTASDDHHDQSGRRVWRQSPQEQEQQE
jgi:hypothetical protein